MIILASNSPRRKELLAKITSDFVVVPSTAEEFSTSSNPRRMALELATRKAMDVFGKNSQHVVIGCDTVVDCNGVVFGKPVDQNHAFQMLSSLSDATHFVHTGVCIVYPSGICSFVVSTQVQFKQLSEQQIWDYIATGSPMDKAGAYGIQDSNFVNTIVGSYDNVVGFPTIEVQQALQKIYKR